jgi:hypothetical protein
VEKNEHQSKHCSGVCCLFPEATEKEENYIFAAFTKRRLLQISGLLRRKLEVKPRSKVFWVRIPGFCQEQHFKSKLSQTFVANAYVAHVATRHVV